MSACIGVIFSTVIICLSINTAMLGGLGNMILAFLGIIAAVWFLMLHMIPTVGASLTDIPKGEKEDVADSTESNTLD